MTAIKEITLVVLGLALIGAVVFIYTQNVPHAGAIGYLANNIGAVATTSAATAVTSSTRILSTTTSATDPTQSYTRVYASICNTHQGLPLFIRLDGDKPTNINSAGAIMIASSSCYFITDANQYNGSVTASSSNQASITVLTTQYVQ